MDSLSDRPAGARRRAPAVCAALGSAALLAASLAAPASAGAASATASAEAEGAAVLTVGKRVAAARGLRAAGVRITRVSPARVRGTRFTFGPKSAAVRSSSVGAVRLRGGLRFRAGRRSVALTDLRVSLRSRQGRISARVAGRRMTVFTFATGSKRLTLRSDPPAVQLSSTYASLTRSAARVVARRLGRRGVVPGRLGKLKIDVAEVTGQPEAKPGEPPFLARPRSAVAAHDVAIYWHVRESFVRYVSGFGGSIAASGGATAGSPSGTPPLVYDYRFSEATDRSWHDPSSDTTALYGSGTVRFRVSAHGIDLAVSDPEVELNGADSRVIFRVAEGGNEGSRQVVMKLGLVPKATGPDGSVTYEMLPGSIPEGEASSFFGGFYQPGDPFGWMTVTFRPGS